MKNIKYIKGKAKKWTIKNKVWAESFSVMNLLKKTKKDIRRLGSQIGLYDYQVVEWLISLKMTELGLKKEDKKAS